MQMTEGRYIEERRHRIMFYNYRNEILSTFDKGFIIIIIDCNKLQNGYNKYNRQIDDYNRYYIISSLIDEKAVQMELIFHSIGALIKTVFFNYFT